nr:hypothetical protein [uncultured bacterium]
MKTECLTLVRSKWFCALLWCCGTVWCCRVSVKSIIYPLVFILLLINTYVKCRQRVYVR